MTFFRFDSLAGGMSLFVELNESSLLAVNHCCCQWFDGSIDRCPHFIILFHWNRSLQTTLGRLTWLLGHYGILGEKNKSL